MTTIISWNVNGLRALHRKGGFDWLLHEKPDIFCLQEVKALPEQLPDVAREPVGYHSFFHAPTEKKGYSGVAIYTKDKPLYVSRDMGIPEMDTQGRIIMAEYKAPAGGGAGFTLINGYFPNGGGAPEKLRYKLDFYDYFLEFVEKLHKKQPNIIVCGDINVAHREIDLARPKANENHVGFLPIERAWMDKFLSKGPARGGVNWIDVFRHFCPDRADAYTYWDMKSFARERNVGWRIDYFITSPEMIENVESIEILDKILGSDHCPLKLTLK